MNDFPDVYQDVFGLEEQIIELQAKLDDARQRRIRGQAVADYELTDWDGRLVRLSALFGNQDQMILIHNMGMSCGYCTLWADGFNGQLQYIERISSFVVVSPDDIEKQKSYAAKRGWKFRMVSAKGTSLFKDMGFEEKDGSPWPGMSTLYKDSSGQLRRHSMASFGPGDKFCPVFSFLDLLPHKRDLDL